MPRTFASLSTTLQYRLLRRIAPIEPGRMDGAVYAGKSKLRTLLGGDLLELTRGADVLDFGCGLGQESIDLARVAKSVYGLDILPAYIARARQSAVEAGVADHCTFSTEPPSHQVDIVISIDSFEHFADPASVLRQMYRLLRPGGKVLISFGPPWYHPLGGHLFSVFPWAHLIFSEAALIRWRSDLRSDGATRFSEVEGGLNQMSIGRFTQLVRSSDFSVSKLECVPIRKLKPIANRMTREFTTAVVRCVLSKSMS